IRELVRMQARRQWPRFGFAVTDHAADEKFRIVERGAVCVGERVAELATLVDGAWSLRRDVARDAARKRELAEQPPHPLFVFADTRVALAVRALALRFRDGARSA